MNPILFSTSCLISVIWVTYSSRLFEWFSCVSGCRYHGYCCFYLLFNWLRHAYWPEHEIFELSHMRKNLLYTPTPHADVSSGTRNLKVGWSLHRHPLFVYASSEGSGKSAQICLSHGCLAMRNVPQSHVLVQLRFLKPHYCNGKFLFDLILYVPRTIFQLNRDGSSWVDPVLSYIG